MVLASIYLATVTGLECPGVYYPRIIGGNTGVTEISNYDIYNGYILLGGYTESDDIVYNKGSIVVIYKKIEGAFLWALELYSIEYQNTKVSQVL